MSPEAKKPPRWLEIKHRPYGWDQRDYELAAALRSLPSYGLLEPGDWMISVKSAIEMIERHAELRGQGKLRERQA